MFLGEQVFQESQIWCLRNTMLLCLSMVAFGTGMNVICLSGHPAIVNSGAIKLVQIGQGTR